MSRYKSAPSVIGRAFAGQAGAVQALCAWAALVVLWVAAFLFGVAVFLLAGAGTVLAVTVAWRVAGDWAPGRTVMAASAAVWATGTVVFWWLWGVGFDSTDAMRPVPGYVHAFAGLSFVVGTVAFIVVWATLAWAVVRARRSPAVAHA